MKALWRWLAAWLLPERTREDEMLSRLRDRYY